MTLLAVGTDNSVFMPMKWYFSSTNVLESPGPYPKVPGTWFARSHGSKLKLSACETCIPALWRTPSFHIFIICFLCLHLFACLFFIFQTVSFLTRSYLFFLFIIKNCVSYFKMLPLLATLISSYSHWRYICILTFLLLLSSFLNVQGQHSAIFSVFY